MQLMKLNKWIVLFIGLFTLFFLLVVFGLISREGNSLNNPNVDLSNPLSVIGTFFKGVIASPILETLVFQMLIHWLISKIKMNNRYFLLTFLISSSLLFAATHYYSLLYFIYACGAGGVLAYCYFIYKQRKDNAFLMVTLLHATFNCILFCLGLIFNF
jgi:hypothetical protein